MSSTIAACIRCGIRRTVKPGRRGTDLCGDCKVDERGLEAATELRGGQWVTRGCIKVWEQVRPQEDTVYRAVNVLHKEIRTIALDQRLQQRSRALKRYCCEACGCLVLPSEDCPGCLVAARTVAEVGKADAMTTERRVA